MTADRKYRAARAIRDCLTVPIIMTVMMTVGSCAIDDLQPEPEYSAPWDEMPAIWLIDDVQPTCIYSSPDGRIFIGTGRDDGSGQGSVKYSDDEGLSWSAGGRGLNPNCRITDFQSLDARTILASMDRGGVFRSEDGGMSWTQMNNHLEGLEIVALEASSDGIVFAAERDGRIFRSDDGCRSWEKGPSEGLPGGIYGMEMDSQEILYVWYSSHVVYSTDLGDSWSDMTGGLENPSIRRVSVTDSGRIYVGCYNGDVYSCGGPGDGWTMIRDDSSSVWIEMIDAGDDGIIYVSYSADINSYYTMVSRDDGASWFPACDGLAGYPMRCVARGSGHIYGLVSSGRFVWTDPGESAWYIRGDRFLTISSLQADGEGLIAMTGRNLFRRPGLDGEWVHMRRVDSSCFGWYGMNRFINNQLIARSPDGDLFLAGCVPERSLDDGKSWEVMDVDWETTYTIEFDPAGTIFMGTDQGIMRSMDNGDSWEAVNDTLDEIFEIEAPVEGVVYAATMVGLFLSGDNGDSWKILTNGEPVFSVSADGAGNVAAANEEAVLISRDQGTSWQEFLPLRYQESPRKVIISPGGNLGVYTNYRILYLSTLDEPAWDRYCDELPMNAMLTFGEDGYIYYFVNMVHRAPVPFDEMTIGE